MNWAACVMLVLALPATAEARVFIQASAVLPATGVEQLVDLLVGEQQVVNAAAGNFEQSFDETVKAKVAAGAPALEPGLLAALRAAGRAETIAILREGYPGLRGLVTAKLASALTAREITDAIAFYISPTGRKLSAGANAGLRGSSPSEISTNMIAGAVAAMDASDAPALVAFSRTSSAAKVKVLGPQLQQLSVDWAMKLMTANSARLQRIVQDTARSYAAAHPRTAK